MSDIRKAAEELMPILERWKMTYPPCTGADWDKVEALRQALAQQEQEQYVTKVVAMHEDGTYTTERIPLPKREWVGLTRRELDIATLGLEDLSDCYKAIEAKLKEKNT